MEIRLASEEEGRLFDKGHYEDLTPSECVEQDHHATFAWAATHRTSPTTAIAEVEAYGPGYVWLVATGTPSEIEEFCRNPRLDEVLPRMGLTLNQE